jgi:hypothetical protein
LQQKELRAASAKGMFAPKTRVGTRLLRRFLLTSVMPQVLRLFWSDGAAWQNRLGDAQQNDPGLVNRVRAGRLNGGIQSTHLALFKRWCGMTMLHAQ